MTSSDEIFSRERLAGYDPERMANSVALIVGAGALGQNTAQNLALAGIGEIRIVDKDHFEDHNRTRSPAYPLPEEQERFGMNKARAVACKLSRLMTAQRPLMRYAENWIQELGDGAFKDVSVVIGCVDKPSARAYLSDKARLHSLPFIEGGFEAADITLSCYRAVSGEEAVANPCWRCSHQEMETEESTLSCDYYAEQAERAGFIPAIQNAATVLAGLQSEAAILALHPEMAAPLEWRALDLNIRTGQARLVKLATDPFCPGLHRALDGTPLRLKTTSEDSVEELLREINHHFTSLPTVELASPLIWNAPCTKCKRMVAVRSTTRSWRADPRCRNCGGSFAEETEEITDSPMVYCLLTSESDARLLKVSCEQVGLPPLSLIEASVPGSPSKFFELAGSVDQLYKSGDVHEQQQ